MKVGDVYFYIDGYGIRSTSAVSVAISRKKILSTDILTITGADGSQHLRCDGIDHINQVYDSEEEAKQALRDKVGM